MIQSESVDERALELAGISRFDILARKAELRMLKQKIKPDAAKNSAHQYAVSIFVALAAKQN